MLEVSRRSPITGVISTMLLDITASQLELWESGEGYIQNVMPTLDKHEREFLISGCTKEDWIKIYGEDE
tara:strand:+ start:302 stop:508 length:207 start_codon:yes stop_codon:yes gene_type:complete